MIKKVFHSTLAALVVLTVTGLTINMYYCQDHPYDLALFSSAHSCCESSGHCHMPEDGKSMEDHCEDTSIHVESTGEYFGTHISFNFEDYRAIDLIWVERIEVDPVRYSVQYSLKTYWYQEPPPPNEVDLTDIQTFLI